MTTLDFSPLDNEPRLLMQAELKPLQGERFQPTGFPDLGAARYTLADGTEMLLVESAQSVANRLEAAVWDDVKGDLIDALHGLPYVRITIKTKNNSSLGVTTSLHEPHRLNSGYLWTVKGDDDSLDRFKGALINALGVKIRKSKKSKKKEAQGADGEGDREPTGILDMQKIARALFKFDPNSVLHGVFLEKIDGRLRLTRALSGFIEARKVRVAESGGLKTDRVDPTGDPKPDFGMVPFHRTEFVADNITAYFSLDLALLRSYGLSSNATNLSSNATNLLIALALLKVRLFLEKGLRLRTACDLKVIDGIHVIHPACFSLPTTNALLEAMPSYISACKDEDLFADPPITEVSVIYEKKSKKKGEKDKPAESDKDEAKDEGGD
jgi:CRISPR-associated protein Csb1